MYLIIGCGFLGQYVLKELLSKTQDKIICTYCTAPPRLCFETGKNVSFTRCDVTSKADLSALREKCNERSLSVFYFAAYHNIDAVFRNPEAAHRVNVEGLRTFLEVFNCVEALYYASTDCVYGESKEAECFFCETDDCVPINEYGKQKLEAEQLVIERGFHVLRFSLLFGPSLSAKKTFYDSISEALRNGENVEMIDGLARNAIPYEKAAELTVRLALSKVPVPCVLNVCGDSLLTKYALGCKIAEAAGVTSALVKKISATEGRKFFVDKRASTIRLDNALLKEILTT